MACEVGPEFAWDVSLYCHPKTLVSDQKSDALPSEEAYANLADIQDPPDYDCNEDPLENVDETNKDAEGLPLRTDLRIGETYLVRYDSPDKWALANINSQPYKEIDSQLWTVKIIWLWDQNDPKKP